VVPIKEVARGGLVWGGGTAGKRIIMARKIAQYRVTYPPGKKQEKNGFDRRNWELLDTRWRLGRGGGGQRLRSKTRRKKGGGEN